MLWFLLFAASTKARVVAEPLADPRLYKEQDDCSSDKNAFALSLEADKDIGTCRDNTNVQWCGCCGAVPTCDTLLHLFCRLHTVQPFPFRRRE